MTVAVAPAGIWDSEEIADVAAATFPLACPPGSTDDDIAAFVDEMLSVDRFADYLTDPARTVLKASEGEHIVGYAMLIDGDPVDPDVAAVVDLRPTTEISKFYVLPGRHGQGVASGLMDAVVEHARGRDRAGLWLGVNQQNARAQRFYGKHGFAVAGTKTFRVGTQLHHDYVMQRDLRS
ncbi:GNAT family N-acetyltransferase [Rhodococcus rhodnii]|uniref:N-acetlytransferase n=2 Tax=Rhodococcus rhodnii TaxID=38312 RepID=R7WKN3_9NOCA|nr:GNAT family N-acetyltransferase [Rhodococcus rhodnii]EOM75858.1 N-acetlytransferase [Rhodococcus rhodnii LMG 5362]TXG91031.1 GNAT family N-acetyltransferase [Rhodococcus rhodnii]